MLSDEDIFHRYQDKRAFFAKKAPISLVGHSLFDMWDETVGELPQIGGMALANLGISGVSARQYLDVVVKPQRIEELGEHVFIFLGVNDIVKEEQYSPAQVLDWIVQIVDLLDQRFPSRHYYLLEATPVNNIATTDNPLIQEMNAYLQANCPENITFVPTWQDFVGADGKLDLSLCHDGLHFSALGYERLTAVLARALNVN